MIFDDSALVKTRGGRERCEAADGLNTSEPTSPLTHDQKPIRLGDKLLLLPQGRRYLCEEPEFELYRHVRWITSDAGGQNS